MMGKGPTLDVDQFFLDLEDSVAPSAKPAARDDVVSALREHDWGKKTRVVRVNDCTTPWTLRDLDVVISGAGDRIDAIMVPKVQSAGQVEFVDHLITSLEIENSLEVGRIGLELQIENATGLLEARNILNASRRVETVIFGPGDMAAALGMPSLTQGDKQADYPGDVWHSVLVTILVHARHAGVQAIDGPYAKIKDVDGFREMAIRSRGLGFDGKWVLHPDQVAVGNEVFSVTQESFERAADMVDAYDAATSEQQGARGAVMFGEEMIDEANRKMAEATLARGLAQGLVVRPVPAEIPFNERAQFRRSAETPA
jgi:citrate lyase subunit beta/citryl-CoA lyase